LNPYLPSCLNHSPCTILHKGLFHISKIFPHKRSSEIQQAYSDLKKKLQASTKNESTFLNKIETQIKPISAPLSGLAIQSEQRAPDGTISIKPAPSPNSYPLPKPR